MKTFEQWYHSLPVLDQPQFTDVNGRRIVYSIDPELWRLSDWAVSSQNTTLVYLVPRKG